MAIPNDITFTPFDPLPASQLNDLIDNDKALADGTAINNGAITSAKIGSGEVTPDKRSGGFKVGNFSSGSSNGNVSVTGVGFTPKMVEFEWVAASSSSLAANGATDASGGQFAQASYTTSSVTNTMAATNRCFITCDGSNTTREAAFVSMDADGFTINFSKSSTSTAIGYKAYA